MFMAFVNATCINGLFSNETIGAMSAVEPHASFQRLMDAAELATAHLPPSRRITTESAMRRSMEATPQAANNWKERGVSIQAAVDAQRRLSISATWVLDGTKPQLIGGGPGFSVGALRVAAIYDQVGRKDRKHIDAAADAAASQDGDEDEPVSDEPASPPQEPTRGLARRPRTRDG